MEVYRLLVGTVVIVRTILITVGEEEGVELSRFFRSLIIHIIMRTVLNVYAVDAVYKMARKGWSKLPVSN